uniref:CRAL-TRIO domain-containing protein n=1 Tax=Pseudictyota dubia TaxID=2749911 RepID=A0A7R9W0J9_9STRA
MALGRSIHQCHPSYFFHNFAPVFKMLVGERLRKRLKVHYGSIADVLTSLSKFGLGRDRVPEEIGGTLKVDVLRWLSDRMAAEGAAPGCWTMCCCSESLALSGTLSLSKIGTIRGKNKGRVDFDRDEDNIESIIALMSGGKQLHKATKGLSVPLPDLTQVGGSLLTCTQFPTIINTEVHEVSAEASPNSSSSSSPLHLREQLPEPSFNVAPRTKEGKIEPTPNCSAVASRGRLETSSVLPASLNGPVVPSGVSGKVLNSKKKGKRWRDPRMTRAVQAKVESPKMSLLDALISGGYDYQRTKPNRHTDKDIRDSEGVLLYQRKNHLCRRLRDMRNCEGDKATGTDRARRASVSKPVAKPPKISGKRRSEWLVITA